MEPTFYVSETMDCIVISREPSGNTVFFSDNFDLVLDWAYRPEDTVPYAKDEECDGNCNNCECYY
jgi:hypothetical protein